MNSPLSALRADEITADDRRAVAEFCDANADSAVSIFLRRLMAVTDHGVDVTALSNDTELSPNAAAKLLKMSRPHLLTFMNRGLLPYSLVGSHRRIKVSDLLAFMDGRENGAAIVAEALGTGSAAERPLTADEIADLEDL